LTDTLVGSIDNRKADDFMTSGNVVLRFEVIKCLRSEILLHKNYSDEYMTESSVFRRESEYDLYDFSCNLYALAGNLSE
jgi:hypothetical protein